MTHTKSACTTALLLAVSTFNAHAALESRSGGTMVYDTDLNITWVADANLFKTQAAADASLVSAIIASVGTVAAVSGPHTLDASDFDTTTGYMTWWGAQAWAAHLTFGGASDWRLPSHPCGVWAPDCKVYGVGQPGSEMGHLFYSELGGQDFQAISAQHNANYGLFSNVADFRYWSGTQGVFPFNPDGAYATSFSNGDQYLHFQYQRDSHAWAVHDGDIGSATLTPVPEPGTYALMLAGLAGMAFAARRRRA